MSAGATPLRLTSLANPRVKDVVRLRQRSHRDEQGLMLIEGYREIRRAVDSGHPIRTLFLCEALFQGPNEPALIAACRAGGTEIVDCAPPVFAKLAYRDRPDGLLALAPQIRLPLDRLPCPADALLVVAEAVEKPGNLGTILRSADATGAHGVIVCDRCTDINNPNVVRASVGALFMLPVVETGSPEALAWLRARGVRIVAATPHADTLFTDADLRGPTAIAMGAEQYGLSATWMDQADIRVRIPMLGRCDSLNVASATTLMLYEAVRQRGWGARAKIAPDDDRRAGAFSDD